MPILREFRGKIELFSTHALLCGNMQRCVGKLQLPAPSLLTYFTDDAASGVVGPLAAQGGGQICRPFVFLGF